MKDLLDLSFTPHEWFILTSKEWWTTVVRTLTRFQVEKLLLQAQEVLGKKEFNWEEAGKLSLDQFIWMLDFLPLINNNAIQTILREVDSTDIVRILRWLRSVWKTDQVERFFTNMSKRAWWMLRDDMDSQLPLNIERLEVSIWNFLNICHQLELLWKIVIPKPGEKYIE